MSPLLTDGTKVIGLEGYYNCNEIERNEVVILEFQTREESFVKRIAAVPGDILEFQGNYLKLNGEILKNSANEPYLFNERSQRILGIPLKDSKVPEGRYLILGEEQDPNAYDSRQFGLVEKAHIKGRVIKQEIE